MKRKSNTPLAAPANTKHAKNSASPSTPATTEPKQSKLVISDETIKNEERRRIEERSKRTIFMKNGGKVFKHYKDYKTLHPDVVDVKAAGSAAWLIFPTETQCEKAFKELSTKKVRGKALDLDLCGAKSKNAEKIISNKKSVDRPMDKKKLLIKGFPSGTTADKLQLIFPNAKEIYMPHSKKFNTRKQRFGFVLFENETDAFNSFKKAETLKIAGSPVDVLYARQVDPAQTTPTSDNASSKTNVKQLPNGKPVKSTETSGKVVNSKDTPPKSVNGKSNNNVVTPTKGKDTPKTKASNAHIDTPAPKGKTTPGKTQEAKNTPAKQSVVATPAKQNLKTTPKSNGKSPALPTSKGLLKPNGKILAKEDLSDDDEDLDDEELDDEELDDEELDDEELDDEELEDEDSDIPSSNEGIEEAGDDDDDDN